MTYSATMSNLLATLARKAPVQCASVMRDERMCRHGLLSVGLKIHCLGDYGSYEPLIYALGGRKEVLDRNMYRHGQSSFCIVLPPVGNAQTAIHLLEAIEAYTGSEIFDNEKVVIQVCSPGRLDALRCALLGISFYLGSDRLRRFDLEDMRTTVSDDGSYRRGRRLVIYDASGTFDRDFEWWLDMPLQEKPKRSAIMRLLQPQTRQKFVSNPGVVKLPMTTNRTDIIGARSRADVHNINLVASLLTHCAHEDPRGIWRELGRTFERELMSVLSENLLDGITHAPWVHESSLVSGIKDDHKFYDAMQELMNVAFEEAARIERGVTDRNGLLYQIQAMLTLYRDEIVARSTYRQKER